MLSAAMCCAASGQDEMAATLYGAAEQLYEAGGFAQIEPLESIRHDADIARLEISLGKDRFLQLRDDGARLTFEHALEVARAALGITEPQFASTRIDSERTVSGVIEGS
jgi:hypothetical protein